MKKVILSFAFLFAMVCMYPTVLLTEDFDYAASTVIGETDNWTTTGTLTAGDGRVADATTLEYCNTGGTYGHSGSKTLKHSYSSGTDYITYRAFAKVTSGAVYLTYMYKADGKQSQSAGELLGLTNSATSVSARPWVGMVDSGETDDKGKAIAKTGVFRIGLTRQSGTGSDISWGDAEYSQNDVHLIVLKYDFTGESPVASLFVDPEIGSSEPSATISATDGTARNNIGYVMFRNQGSSKSNYYVGGIRVSTTWAEAVRAVETPPVGVAKVVTNLNDGTWGEATTWEKPYPYESGLYPSSVINGFELSAALIGTGSKTYTETSEKFTNRIIVDKATENGMVTLPAVCTIDKVDIYATTGTADQNMTLQRYNYRTGLWEDVATYHFDNNTDCHKFSTTINSNITTRLRITNASSGTKYIWKIETTPNITRQRIEADFSDEVWSTLGTSTTTATVNEVDFTSCSLSSSTYYATTGERFTQRVNMGKSDNGGAIEFPAIVSAAGMEIIATAGSDNKDLKIQKYNYYTCAWVDVETLHFYLGGIYYRFLVTFDSPSATKLRLVNADGSSKYILKAVTYSATPSILASPVALDATNISAHSFTTRWTSVEGAAGYRVIRYNDGAIERTETVGAGVTTFTFRDSGNKGVKAETEYSYAVVAIGDGETTVDSDPSNKVAVTTAAEITDTYTRTVTNGNYGTICLPKAASALSDAGAVFFKVAGKVMDGSNLTQIVFDEVTSLEAGKPYVFQATSDELNIPLIDDAVAEPDNSSSNGLIGAFTVAKVPSSVNVYVLSNNLLYCSKGQSYYVGENRAYFNVDDMSEYSGAAPAPGRRRVVMHAAEEQVATALDELTTTNSCCKIVRNGQIIIIRNGEQYDITGRQIK